MSGPVRSKPSVLIGSRWRPGPLERRDTEIGSYEAVNSRMDSRAELDVQRALLSTVRSKSVERRIAQAQAATRVNET